MGLYFDMAGCPSAFDDGAVIRCSLVRYGWLFVLLAAAHDVDSTMARCSRSSLAAASRAAAHGCFAHAAAHAAMLYT